MRALLEVERMREATNKRLLQVHRSSLSTAETMASQQDMAMNLTTFEQLDTTTSRKQRDRMCMSISAAEKTCVLQQASGGVRVRESARTCKAACPCLRGVDSTSVHCNAVSNVSNLRS